MVSLRLCVPVSISLHALMLSLVVLVNARILAVDVLQA
jgi:hypothetical protein